VELFCHHRPSPPLHETLVLWQDAWLQLESGQSLFLYAHPGLQKIKLRPQKVRPYRHIRTLFIPSSSSLSMELKKNYSLLNFISNGTETGPREVIRMLRSPYGPFTAPFIFIAPYFLGDSEIPFILRVSRLSPS
jgi:hypothetical protein